MDQMANMVVNTHGASLAVNHPAQGQQTHTNEAASQHFSSDAVAHGTETLSTIAQGTANIIDGAAGWVLAPGAPGSSQGSTFVPASGNPNAVPGPNPSYIVNSNGTYTFSGNSGAGGATTAPTLSGAISQWVANNTGQGQSPSNASPAGSGTTTDPFSQLIGLVNSGALNVPSVSTDAQSTAPTVAQGTGSPDMTLPLILFLLAAVAVWWWWKHKHKKAAAAD